MMKDKIIFIILGVAAALIVFYGCDLTSPNDTGAPFNVSLQEINDSTVKISWSYSAAAGDTITFTIARKVGESSWDETYDTVEDTYHYFDNIDIADTLVYGYKVKAYNASEETESPFSSAVAHISNTAAPTDLVISQPTEDALLLTWQDHCLGEEGFYIDRKQGTADWQHKYASLDANTTTFTDAAVLYEDVIYSVYGYFEDEKTPAIADTVVATLAAPSALTLTKPFDTKVLLQWTDNSSVEEGFRIDRRIGYGGWEEAVATVPADSTRWMDDITLPAATVTYRIVAYNGTFNSLISEEATTNVRMDVIGAIATPGNATKLSVDYLTVYVADYYGGLAIIDCYNPDQPAIVSTVNLPDRTLSASVDGTFLYTTGNSGSFPGLLTKIDVSNIASPIITGSTATNGIANDIAISGDHAFVAEGENGLSVVYVSSSTPLPVTTLSIPGNAKSLTISGQYALIATALGGISVVDIVDPNLPVLVSSMPTNGLTQNIVTAGNFAYTANGEEGMEIIDITMIASPASYATLPTGGFVSDIAVADGYAYVLDKEQGLYIADIANPAVPTIIGILPMETQPVAIEVSGSYAYILDNQGLKLIQIKE